MSARQLASSCVALACVALPLAARAQGAPAAAASPAPAAATAPADAAAEPAAEPDAPKKKASGPKEDDPLAIPEGIAGQLGSSHTGDERPLGARSRTGLWPFAFKERVGNTIKSAVFPLYYDRRVLDDANVAVERESFYGLYYRKRSAKTDVDAAFPAYFRWRDDKTVSTVVPPVLWRDAPGGEWHRWLAPLVFAGNGPTGGYFHAPALLTFSRWDDKKSFSLIGGLGFHDRAGRDVDWGVAPFVFGGHDADKLTSYLFIPPLLTYHSSDRDNGKATTVVGPVVYRTAPGSVTFDILPFYLHHKDEDGSATTLLPFFRTTSRKDGRESLVTPLFATSRDADGGRLTITPFYSRYRGRTSLDLAGPVVPLFAHYRDPDLFEESWLVGPVWTSSNPTGSSLITPLFAHWNDYGVSRKTWVFPTIEHTVTQSGWEFDIHPLLYTAKAKNTSHTVLAPVFWDFVAPKKRSTVLFPIFWRFADEEGTAQLALNTLYLERPSTRGANWDFYFLPVFHVGQEPQGSSWDVLFGLVGYKRQAAYKQLKLLWIPIDLTKPPALPATPPPASALAAPASPSSSQG